MNVIKDLISIPSPSGSELKICQYIFDKLSSFGGKPFSIDGNVVLHIKGEKSSTACILNAHMDTVVSGNVDLWTHPPLKGTEVDGKIYGLGASDEKATITSYLLLAEQMLKTKPTCDVFFTFVRNEEVDGSGTAQVMKWFSKLMQPNYEEVSGILGEPTGLNECEIAHKGNIFLSVTTKGDSGHGSNPQAIKTHSVMQMMSITKKIKVLSEVWKVKYKDEILGEPSIGLLTSILAGDKASPNKFPDSCTATFDIRTTPKLHDIAIDEIRKVCPETKVEALYPPIPYGLTHKTETIVQAMSKVTSLPIIASTWSNDLCFFTKYNIPAIVLGPGEKHVIHKPDEYCFINKIEKAKNIYLRIITKWTEY